MTVPYVVDSQRQERIWNKFKLKRDEIYKRFSSKGHIVKKWENKFSMSDVEVKYLD